ncbi:MAG: glycosyltransferase [Candidatus Omnitrophica bacterium]|nr:glycosyltransferase [Candidatus Omnitrophota bacterium]
MALNAVLYFVKYPEPGKVKTRLAKVVGDDHAAQAYRELAEANLGILYSLPQDFIKLFVVFDPPEKEAKLKSWINKTNVIPAPFGQAPVGRSVVRHRAVGAAKAGIQTLDSRLKHSGMTLSSDSLLYWPQKGADLGSRLQNAFRFAFDNGFKKVMAIGSDTLSLRADLILKGFEALDFYDVVIGPAKDGGYYSIGMNTHSPLSSPPERGRGEGEGVLSIFENIPWSTAHVLDSTLRKLNEKNLSYYLLQKLDDLDEVENFRGGRPYEIFTQWKWKG